MSLESPSERTRRRPTARANKRTPLLPVGLSRLPVGRRVWARVGLARLGPQRKSINGRATKEMEPKVRNVSERWRRRIAWRRTCNAAADRLISDWCSGEPSRPAGWLAGLRLDLGRKLRLKRAATACARTAVACAAQVWPAQRSGQRRAVQNEHRNLRTGTSERAHAL